MDFVFYSDKSLRSLADYLNKLSAYSHFDDKMQIVIYCRASDNCFVAFESVKYLLCFNCSAFKISSILSTELVKIECCISDLIEYVKALSV